MVSSQEQNDQLLLEKFEAHRDFTKVFLDGFVLVNPQRKILKFNQMFCALLGIKANEVKKAETLDHLIRLDLNDEKDAMSELLASAGGIRMDEVKGRRPGVENDMFFIVNSYNYYGDDGVCIGSCVLLRDVTAEANLQGKYKERTIQSFTDPLTSLFTRRYFESWMDKELERCRRTREIPRLALLLFDLDKFKTVNDTYGHQGGDYVLSETSRVLRDNSRKNDILGRYGGEELLVLLVGSTPRGACLAAEKFREGICKHEFIFEGKKIPVSTSVGVSVVLDPDETKEAIIARADKCLYMAKENGRNCSYGNFGQGNFRVSDFLSDEDDTGSDDKLK